jgi:hypothetical protein
VFAEQSAGHFVGQICKWKAAAHDFTQNDIAEMQNGIMAAIEGFAPGAHREIL